ncbi:protein yippee-like At5g53940 isoform X1 [Malania oleifera]|uniref:protein yippee-like At5g53940 isoform X1 n=1 Tax=Malania oleifera TaxID=397392 RepID=UPI0025AE88C6|nr:protein yippee-like At5g53940 isoform X1 [Malania oleifera]
MGRIFLVELEGSAYNCRFCHSPLALADNILSRSFSCRQGQAYLFNNAVNITLGPQEERMMMSGVHTVEDIFCCSCGQILGWKYVAAHDKTQKYKEGKFVLERYGFFSFYINGTDPEHLTYIICLSGRRWRITGEVAEELNPENRLGSSDAESS